MKKIIYLLFMPLIMFSACEKDGAADQQDEKEEEQEQEQIEYPASIAGNNKIKILETTEGASTPEAEYDLDVLIVISETDDKKPQTVTILTKQSAGPPMSIYFSKGIPTQNTIFGLENMYTGGKDGLTVIRGGKTYSSLDDQKLYVRKNSNGTTTFFFNELDLRAAAVGSILPKQKVSAKFTIPATLNINISSPTAAKNILVDEQ